MPCNGTTNEKFFFFCKPLVNWNEMWADGEIWEYMVAIAIELYEAKANLE